MVLRFYRRLTDCIEKTKYTTRCNVKSSTTYTWPLTLQLHLFVLKMSETLSDQFLTFRKEDLSFGSVVFVYLPFIFYGCPLWLEELLKLHLTVYLVSLIYIPSHEKIT